MRKCIRCGSEMKENCAIKVEGAGYGIILSSDENKLFGGRMNGETESCYMSKLWRGFCLCGKHREAEIE